MGGWRLEGGRLKCTSDAFQLHSSLGGICILIRERFMTVSVHLVPWSTAGSKGALQGASTDTRPTCDAISRAV